MTTPEENNHGLITTGASGLIRRMDQRLELVGRLLHEIESKNLIRIDLEMATKFLADPNAVDLSKGQILDDDAAEALSRHSGSLSLDGLTTLSDAAAFALSRHQGEWLPIASLTPSIAKNTLRKVFRFHPEALALAIIDVCDYEPNILVVHRHITPILGDLEKANNMILNPTHLAYLIEYTYRGLDTESTDAISPKQGWTSIESLNIVSDAAAKKFPDERLLFELSRLQGWLSLDGMTVLSDAAAAAFSRHRGGLSLDRLTTLSDAAAELLSRHEGCLSLDGLTTLSDATAEALSRHQAGLWLNGLTTLGEAAAESLFRHKGQLFLKRLTRLSKAAAEALSLHQESWYGESDPH